MFGLGMPEILMILAIALIVIGPKKLPDLAKTLGRAMGEFKRSAQDFKQSLDVETTVKDITDIEGTTETIDINDATPSKPEDKIDPKDSSTDNDHNNLENLNGKADNTDIDLKDNKESSENPLKNQKSNHNEDSNQQTNSESNKKLDTD